MESLSKGIRVVEFLGQQSGPSGVREIARAAKTSPATAHRILRVLCLHGWVQRPDGYSSKYELSGRVTFTTLLGTQWPDEIFHPAGKTLDEGQKRSEEGSQILPEKSEEE